MRFRIVREIPTRSGIRTTNVGIPAMRIDALTLHAPDADTALANARRIVADTRGLVAVPEFS